MNTLYASTCLWIASALLACHSMADERSSYPWVREIDVVITQEELAAVTLDHAIWDAAMQTPAVRIVDDHGVPVPHLLRKAGGQRRRTVREPQTSTIRSLTETPDNRINLSLDLAEKAKTINRIELVTPLKDFERLVTVIGTDSEGGETLLVENALVYDYSRFADVRNVFVQLPENHYRRFRIEIQDVTDERQSPRRQISRTLVQGQETQRIEQGDVTTRPFRMDAIRTYREQETESHTVERKDAVVLKSWNAEVNSRRQTIINIETFNHPLSSLSLQTPERNFSRRVTIDVPVRDGGITTWRTIGSATVYRISFRDFSREQMDVTFPEQQARLLRLTISNDDNPPLEVSGVTASGPVWQALFIAEPGRRVSLYHGDTPVRPVRQDTLPIERILAGGYTPITLPSGDSVENRHYRQPATSWTRWIGTRTAFVIAVAIMIAVLGLVLVRAIRQIDPLNSEDTPSP